MTATITFYTITALTFTTALFSGWSIVAYLEKEGVIEKKTPLMCLSWSALFEYYKINKEKSGSYGIVGTVYIISVCALIVEAIITLFLL